MNHREELNEILFSGDYSGLTGEQKAKAQKIWADPRFRKQFQAAINQDFINRLKKAQGINEKKLSARDEPDEIMFARGRMADLAGVARGNIAIPRGELAAEYQADALRLIRNIRKHNKVSQGELSGRWRFARSGLKGSRREADMLRGMGLMGQF